MKRIKPSKAGRKPLSASEPSINYSVRLLLTQKNKLHRLGGGAWVRAKLDKVKE